jgi:hypothetical protein
MVPQGEVSVSPFHIGAGTLEGVPVVLEQKTTILWNLLYLLASNELSLSLSSGGKANGRRCGRKPICQVKSDSKRGKYQWLLPTIGVDEDLRFSPRPRP